MDAYAELLGKGLLDFGKRLYGIEFWEVKSGECTTQGGKYTQLKSFQSRRAINPGESGLQHHFPWITTVAYTSEVVDETAQGEYLYLCARTHVTHDLAILKMLEESTCVYKNIWNLSEEGIEAAHIRLCPVIV